MGLDIRGLGFEPGFGGGKAGATEALFAFKRAVATDTDEGCLSELVRIKGLLVTEFVCVGVFMTIEGMVGIEVGTTAGTGGALLAGFVVCVSSGSFLPMGLSLKPLN